MWKTTASFFIRQWISERLETDGTNNTSDTYKIDTTQHYFPSEIWQVKPAWELILKIATIIPIVFFGILGNSSLIHVIIRTRLLKTTTNLLIANMAFADLLTLLICPWMFLCDDFFQNYIFGMIGCRTQGFLTHALTLVAVFSLSAISYDRVSAIVLRCSGKLSRRTAYTIICFTWLAGLAIAAPLAFLRDYEIRQWIDFKELYCTEDPVRLASYWNIFIVVSVLAPLAIMAVCYSVILIKLDKYETIALKSKHPIAVKYKGRVAMILALVVVVFIICRVPFTVFVLERKKLLEELAEPGTMETMQQLWYTSHYLVLLNAAVNPILYGFASSSLRRALLSCPTIAWILKYKKSNGVQSYSPNWKNMPNTCAILIPRSPCFCPDNQQEPIPNISSNLNKRFNHIPHVSKARY